MRQLVLAAMACCGLAIAPAAVRAQTAQQALVDRATLAVQEMLTGPGAPDQIADLKKARAVMVCPRVFKAGFVIGGSGGGCVLVARDGGGSWSAPAFYNMGSASVGPQIGIQDSEAVMMIMTDRGLSAVMDTQFKIGGDASIAFATVGAGVEGATSVASHSDIIAFEQTRGLFVGVSLAGSTLTTDTPANQAYYGRPLGARGIVVQMEANNAGADPLRAMLGRFGTPVVATASIASPEPVQAVDTPPPAPRTRTARTVVVSRQNLPPPPPAPPR